MRSFANQSDLSIDFDESPVNNETKKLKKDVAFIQSKQGATDIQGQILIMPTNDVLELPDDIVEESK